MKKTLLALLCIAFVIGFNDVNAQRNKKKGKEEQAEPPKPEEKKPKNGMKTQKLRLK